MAKTVKQLDDAERAVLARDDLLTRLRLTKHELEQLDPSAPRVEVGLPYLLKLVTDCLKALTPH